MDQSLYDQINSLVEKSQKILLLTHAKADPDGLGASLSMYSVLKELGKDVVVATNDPVGESLDFLPAIDILQNSVGSSDFVISLNTGNNPVSKVKYNSEEGKFNIVVSPKGGRFSEGDVSFSQIENKYDLIMVFDTGNLEHLGGIYDNNVEMFYQTPVINIDHHASNTDYGQVNMVDVTAASTTEVVFEYLQDLEKRRGRKLITEDIATLLLAGLITDTGSFQHANTSPQAMEVGAKLLDLGARQQEIIKHIYKTKKLSTLKLWGTILSKVQTDPVYRMVWSTISPQDLQETGATADESEGIIDDLLSNAPGAEVVFLIKWNDPNLVSISMRSTTNSCDVGKFCAENGGGGHVRAAGFKVKDGRNFEEIVNEVVQKVRDYQAKRLNIAPETAPQAVQPQFVPAPAPTQAQQEMPVPTEEPKETTYLNFDAPEQMQAEQPAAPAPTMPEAPVQEKREELAGVPTDDLSAFGSEPQARREGDHGPDNAVPAAQPTEVQAPTPQPPIAGLAEEGEKPKRRRRRRRRRRAPRDLVRGPDGRFARKNEDDPNIQPPDEATPPTGPVIQPPQPPQQTPPTV